jgi:translation initiation factor IF-3
LIKRHKRKQVQNKYYRTNERIYAHTLRVLDPEGKQIGILSKYDALQKARELELDLVEVAATAKPPVARIIDYKKFVYQEEKKKRDEKKKAKVSETKEIRLGPFMSDNDLDVSIRRGRDFLEDGNKIRLVLKFRGRQIIHPEFGHKTIGKMIAALSDIAKVERDPHMEGKQLVALISAERKKHGTEEKNKEVSIEKVQGNEDGESPVLTPVQEPSETS